MEHVYVLQHEHAKQWKFIGIYGTRDTAAEAVLRLVIQPGFKDAPEGFEIEKYKVEGEGGDSHTDRVYVLVHEYEDENTLDEEGLVIGIYRTRETAVRAIHDRINSPVYRHAPDGFHIGNWKLDSGGWEQGYISVAEALAEFTEKN